MNERKTKTGLRHGYTTGACAAAAAKAAAIALKEQRNITEVKITLPTRKEEIFPVYRCEYTIEKAVCSVIKDAGDDPDSTNGAEIKATVMWNNEGIKVNRGEGVGVVTKPGLEIPVGEPAINPVPMKMITESVREVVGDKGADVTISVPDGEAIAKKTLNSRLGIIGGISIIGTTGIVVPYSIEAYQASISQSLDIAKACGCDTIVISTGRRSEKYAQEKFDLPEEAFILAGDFIGYTLEACALRNIEKIIIWGMTGKISKIAVGYMYTNISDSNIDFDFLLDVARNCGVPDSHFSVLKTAVTANQFRRLLPQDYQPGFCNMLCRLAAEKCRDNIDGKCIVSCIMSEYEGKILGTSDE